MNGPQIIEILVREYGYGVRGRIPSGWVLIRPDGSLMRSDDVKAELERLTNQKLEKLKNL